MNLICKSNIFPEKDITKIRNLIGDDLEIFELTYLKKISVGFSYVVFILKEITEFIIQQTSKGISNQNLRLIYKKMKKDLFQKIIALKFYRNIAREID